ncbi:MAG: DUF1499 domain-containing protein [Alphaproteobacteria bacterium]|nr:DUF1499 domain-containing protein [Alphaproteobacteria bacterium]
MRIWLERLGWLALVVAVLAALSAAAAGPGYQLGWWPLGVALQQIVKYSVFALIGAAGVGLLTFLVLFALPPREGWQAGLAALVLAALAGAYPLSLIMTARSVPAIHDITTDTEDPPVFVDLLAVRTGALNPPDYDGPRVAALQKTAYPDIVPLDVEVSPDRAFAEAQALAQGLGWHVVAAVPEQGRIEASQKSFWFGFVDDVVIRVSEREGGSRIDMRSKSRVGRSDIGANAARIRHFFAELEERLAK